MKCLIFKSDYVLTAIAFLSFTAFNSVRDIQALSTDETTSSSFDPAEEWVYYNDAHLELVKKKIKAKDPYFTRQYNELLKEGNAALEYKADPVTDKTQVPPSKDMYVHYIICYQD